MGHEENGVTEVENRTGVPRERSGVDDVGRDVSKSVQCHCSVRSTGSGFPEHSRVSTTNSNALRVSKWSQEGLPHLKKGSKTKIMGKLIMPDMYRDLNSTLFSHVYRWCGGWPVPHLVDSCLPPIKPWI